MLDSFDSRDTLTAGGAHGRLPPPRLGPEGGSGDAPPVHAAGAVGEPCCVARTATPSQAEDIEALANWRPNSAEEREVAFAPARVLLQDFTGVPAVVDLASMRDALETMGGDPSGSTRSSRSTS